MKSLFILTIIIIIIIIFNVALCKASDNYRYSYGFRVGTSFDFSSVDCINEKYLENYEDKHGINLDVIPEEDVKYPPFQTVGLSFASFIDMPVLSFLVFSPEIMLNRRILRILYRDDYYDKDIYEFQTLWNLKFSSILKLTPIRWKVRPGLYFGSYIIANFISKFNLACNCDSFPDEYDGPKKGNLTNISFLNFGLIAGIEIVFWKLFFDIEMSYDFTPIYNTSTKLYYGEINFMTGFRL